MQQKNDFYINCAVSLVMLVPVPPRFAYGVILVIMFNLLILLGTLFKRSLEKLQMQNMLNPLLILFLVSVSMLTGILLAYYDAVLSLTLNFVLFLPVFTSLVVGKLLANSDMPLGLLLRKNILYSAFITGISLVFLCVREIFGYGSITLLHGSGIVQHQIIPPQYMQTGIFWVTIPGGITLAALLLVLCTIAQKVFLVKREQQ